METECKIGVNEKPKKATPMGFEAANVDSLFKPGLYPVLVSTPDTAERYFKIPTALWPELADRCRTRSLRQVANEYGVSHEAVRRTLRKGDGLPAGKLR